jgi:predicted rRNA methylase YqxC with S4 and FtsJ domains
MAADTDLPCVVTLVKPHYELDEAEKKSLLRGGALDPAHAEHVMQRTLEAMPALGATVVAHTRSPLTGRKSSGGNKAAGNVEYLALLRPAAIHSDDR